MVAQSDLNKVNLLNRQLKDVVLAVHALDSGERINLMTIGSNTVSTDDIDYPPQMVTAIKAALDGRKNAIVGELEKMGVTEVEIPAPPAPWQPEAEDSELQRTAAKPAPPKHEPHKPSPRNTRR